MKAKLIFRAALIPALFLMASFADSAAQSRFDTTEDERPTFGFRFGYYTDIGSGFFGTEAHRPVFGGLIHFVPNIEYVFSDVAGFITANVDGHYDFSKDETKNIFGGGGIALTYLNPKGPGSSKFNIGLNVMLGYGLQLGNLRPYAQAKALLADQSDFVLGFGLRF